MSIKVKKPEVKMNLYETDKDVLKSFITNEKIDGVFTEKYLILQNFADDCRFSSRSEERRVGKECHSWC